MRTAIILAVLVCFPAIAFSSTIIVPDDHPTIQAAINAAVNGDTVLVRSGTYVENIDFLGKAITLKSELGPDVTAIDGNQAGSVVTCQSFEGPTTTLEGFTITNGTGTIGPNSMLVGGGMYNWASDPTLTNCTFSGNSADQGGGMYNTTGSDPTLTDCTFSGNSVDWGGGMYNSHSDPTLTNCTFSGNSVDWGGGMYNYKSAPTLMNCTFSGNAADSYGGGMYNYIDSSPTLTDCTFSGNSAYYGGGMSNYECAATLTNSTFSGNSAAALGGGMFGYDCTPTLTNCTFYGNSAGSSGGGIYNLNGSDPTLTNCILWKDTPDEILNSSSSPTVTYSCVQGGHAGTGNIDQDPLFVEGITGDFHLSFPSPCKDTGDNAAIPPGLLEDYEGDPRIAYGTVDMGADEFHAHIYYTGDAFPGGSVELKFIDLPGASPVGFWIAFDAMDTPLPGAYGDWWLLPPMAGLFPLPPIPSNGVYVLPGTIPASPPGPYTLYLQGIMGTPMKLTNLCTLEVK